jgi:uncharacterized protein YerC
MAHRWQVVRLLEEGLLYPEISKRTHARRCGDAWRTRLRYGEGGYRLVLDRMRRRRATV